MRTVKAARNKASTVAASDTVTVQAGNQFVVVATVAGNVKVGLSGGGTVTFAVPVGTTVMEWEVGQVFVTGTTATATYYNLDT